MIVRERHGIIVRQILKNVGGRDISVKEIASLSKLHALLPQQIFVQANILARRMLPRKVF